MRSVTCSPGSSGGSPEYFGETNIQTFGANTDGSIRFDTGGSLDDDAAVFRAFQLADHRGVVDTHDAGSWSYHAIAYVVDAGSD